jgi:opacity protein-like surface antigen
MTKLVPVLALAFSSAAFAQTGEFWFSGGESLLSNSGLGTTQAFGGAKDDLQLTDGFRWGLTGSFNQGSHYGYEFGYAHNGTGLKFNTQGGATQGMHFHQVAANFLVYALRDGKRIRPFATGGVHFSNYVQPGASIASGGGDTKFGVNGGFGVKVHVHSFWGLRLDYRYFTNPKPFNLPLRDGWLHQNVISAGIGIGL